MVRGLVNLMPFNVSLSGIYGLVEKKYKIPMYNQSRMFPVFFSITN
jgi:hypothetical protein